MSEHDHPILSELSKPAKVLWFELDEISSFVVTFLFLFQLDANMFLSLIFSGLFTYLYVNIKAKNPKGYIFHIFYVIGFSKFEGFESVSIRSYKE